MAEPIEIDISYNDKISATLARIEGQINDLSTAFDRNSQAQQQNATSAVAWGTLYAKAAELAVKAVLSVGDAFGKVIDKTIAYGDQIDGLSKRTGQTTDDVQKLRFAFDQVGIGFDTAVAAGKRLEVGIAKSSKTVAQGLKDIGLSAQQASGDGGLQRVIDSLTKIDDPAKRAAAAVDLFGPAGTKIARFAEELVAAAEKAEKFGLVVNKDLIAAGDQTGDKFSLIAQQVETLAIKFGGAILRSGAFQTVLDILSEALAGLSKFFDENSAAITQFTDTVIILAADALVALVSGVGFVLDAFSGIKVLGVEASGVIEKVGLAAIAAGKALANPIQAGTIFSQLKADLAAVDVVTQKSVSGIVAQNDKWNASLSKVKDGAKALADRIAEGASANKVYADAADKAAKDTDGLREAQERAAKAAEEFEKKVSALFEKLSGNEAAAAQLKVVEEVFNRLGPAASLTDEQLKNVVREFEALGPAIKGSTEALAAFQEQASRDFATVLAEQAKASGQALADISVKQSSGLFEPLKIETKAVTAETQALLAVYEKLGQSKAAKAQEDAQRKVAEQLLKTKAITQEQFDQLVGKTKEAEQETDKLAKALDIATNVMEALGISSDSTLGVLIGGLAAASSSADLLGKSLTDAFSKGLSLDNLSGIASGIAGIVGAFKKATDSASGLSRALGGALVGAKVGQSIGGAIGGLFGPAGAIAGKIIGGVGGAVIGGVVGLLRKPGWVKAGEAAGKALGVSVSKELAKEIEKTAKDLKIDFKSASLLNIDKAIAESGKDARSFAPAILDLISGIEKGAIPAAKGMEQLSKSFGLVREAADKAGVVGDRATVQILQAARAAGTLTDEMKAFTREAITQAIEGVKKFAAQFEDGKFVSGIDFSIDPAQTVERANAQAEIFSTTFFAAVKELGLVGAADAFRDTFAGFSEAIRTALPADAAEALLAPIQQIIDLTAEGSAFRGAAEGAQGLTEALTGIADAGFLTQKSLAAFGTSTQNAFDQAKNAGASQEQAIQAVLPLLQAQVSAAEQYGFQLDANTQGLVDQAKAAGFAFPTDPLIQVVDLLGAIATKLGADIPASFAATGTAAAASAAQTTGAMTATAQASVTATQVAAAAASTATSTANVAIAASTTATISEMATTTEVAVTSLQAPAAASAEAVKTSFEAAFGVLSGTAMTASEAAVASMTTIATQGEAAANSLDLSAAVSEIARVRAAALEAKNAVGGIGGPGGGGGEGGGGNIPEFATGGFVPARPGGTVVRVGEGGEDEFIVPKSKAQGFGGDTKVEFNLRVDGSGLDKATLERAMVQALQSAGGQVLQQIQRAQSGRR